MARSASTFRVLALGAALVACCAGPAAAQGRPRLVADIDQTPAAGAAPDQLTAVGEVLYFTSNDGVHGVELMRSDGTADGTNLVADVRSGGSGSFPHEL